MVVDSDNVGAVGESWFQHFATRAGITATRTTRDRHGWDFRIEVPWAPIDDTRPLDMRPAELSGRVQVKATRARSPRVKVKLDNYERLAKALEPCFIAIAVVGPGDEVTDAYLVHIDRRRVEDALRRLRTLPQGKRDSVHKVIVEITPADEDRLLPSVPATLRDAIQRHAGDQSDYVARKQQWIETVGYDRRSYLLSAQLGVDGETITPTSLSDLAIGLRSVPVSGFTVRRTRFGVSEVVEHVSDIRGTITIGNARPAMPALLIVSAGSDEVTLRTTLVSSALVFPSLDEAHHQIRLEAPFVSLVVSKDKLRFIYALGTSGSDIGRLSDVINAARCLDLIANARLRAVRIRIVVEEDARDVIWNDQGANTADESAVARALLDAAFVWSRFGGLHDPEVSVQELMAQRDEFLLLRKALVGDPTRITISAEPTQRMEVAAPPTRLALIVSTRVTVGEEILAAPVGVVAKMSGKTSGSHASFSGRCVELRLGRRQSAVRGAAHLLKVDAAVDEMIEAFGREGIAATRWTP